MNIPGLTIRSQLGHDQSVIIYVASAADGRLGVLSVGRWPLDDEDGRQSYHEWVTVLVMAARHPNVCDVLGYGLTADLHPYLVAATSRATLADRMAAGGSPPGAVQATAVGLAAGLAAMHSAGLVHGSVRPATTLLTAAGVPVLAGYDMVGPGLAAELRADGFSAPERLPATGGPPAPAADVYELAATIYVSAGGYLPWFAGGEAALTDLRLRGTPLSDPQGVSREFGQALRWALAPAPADRPSAAQFRDTLAAAPGWSHWAPPVPRGVLASAGRPVTYAAAAAVGGAAGVAFGAAAANAAESVAGLGLAGTPGLPGASTLPAAGLQGASTAGLQATNVSGFQAANAAGFEAANTAAFQAANTAGFQAANTAGFQAANTAGFQAAGTAGVGAAGSGSAGVGAATGGLTAIKIVAAAAGLLVVVGGGVVATRPLWNPDTTPVASTRSPAAGAPLTPRSPTGTTSRSAAPTASPTRPPPTGRTTAPPTSTRPATPAAAYPAAGDYTFRSPPVISTASGLKITWTKSSVPTHNGVPAGWAVQITYQNTTSQPITLSCTGWTDPAKARAHLYRGGTYLGPSTANWTLCSSNPAWTAQLGPGQSATSGATFATVPLRTDQVSIEWGEFGRSSNVGAFPG